MPQAFITQAVFSCYRNLSVYRPGATKELIEKGAAKCWFSLSQERLLPTSPWKPMQVYSDTGALSNEVDVSAFFEAMAEVRNARAAWLANNPVWEAPEKFRNIKPGEELKIGDVLAIGDFRSTVTIDRLTDKKAWAGAESFPRIVPESFISTKEKAGFFRTRPKIHPLRPLLP